MTNDVNFECREFEVLTSSIAEVVEEFQELKSITEVVEEFQELKPDTSPSPTLLTYSEEL